LKNEQVLAKTQLLTWTGDW